MRITITEEQFKKLCETISEEGYASHVTLGTFSTPQEANAFLERIRNKYGFSQFNSWVKGTSVIVEIQKSVTDDSYFYEFMDAMKKEQEALKNGSSRMVAEWK